MPLRRWLSSLAVFLLLLSGCPSPGQNDRDDDDDAADDDDDAADDDDDGAAASAAVIQLLPASPLADDTLVLSIQTPAVADDGSVYVDYRVEWRINNSLTESFADAFAIEPSWTLKGETWEATVFPVSDAGEGLSTRVSATIGNSAPRLGAVFLTNANAAAPGLPYAEPQGAFDLDDDTVTVEYEWFVDGIEVSGQSGASLPESAFGPGQEIWVVATPSDGVALGDSVESNHLVAGNATPTITGVSINPISGTETDTFTCIPQGWSDDDGDPEGYEYEWFVDGVPVATTATLDGLQFDKGQAIWCSVTPWDGVVYGLPVSSLSVLIANSPPTVASAAVVPASPTAEDALSALASGWADVDPADSEAYDIEWFVNGSSAGTDATLAAGTAVRGDSVYAEVTPNDGDDTGPSVVTPTALVTNAVPSLSSVSIDTNVFQFVYVYTAVPAGWFDADGDAEGYTYQWYLNASPTGTDVNYTPGALSTGDVVYVSVTPDDGIGQGLAVDSPSFSYGASIQVSPSPLDFGDLEIGCSVTQQFTITNVGQGQATITSVSLTDLGGTAELSVAAPAPSTIIAPGASLSVDVDYDVLTLAPASAELTITSDDPTNPITTVSVVGEAHNGPVVQDEVTTTGAQLDYVLSSAAVESTIVVTRNGAVTTAWTYDASTTTVSLNPAILPTPAAGDLVTIDYALFGNTCTPNSAPSAQIDLLSSAGQCDPVVLSGLNSTDPDADTLIYEWSFESVPAASSLVDMDLLQPSNGAVAFEPDTTGDFTVGLTVFDPAGLEGPLATETVSISGTGAANVAPTVDLGPDLVETIPLTCTSGAYGTFSCQSCSPNVVLGEDAIDDPDSLSTDNIWVLGAAANGETLTPSADGTTAVLAVPTQTATAPGTQTGSVTVDLTATDCEGTSGTDSYQVTWECVWN